MNKSPFSDCVISSKSIIRASLSTFRDFDHTSHDGHVGVHRGLARRRRRLRIPPRHVSAICTTIHDALAYPPLFCAGVHEIENRKDAAALLAALAQPVLLEPEPHTATTAPAVGKDTGIYMEERLSLRGQRELWSALARLSNGLAHTQTLHLATRFLECAEKKRWRASDPVCRSLAQMIVTASDADASSSTASRRREVDEDESLATIKRDAAFKEAMRQLMLSRLCSPSSLLSALSIAGSSSGDGTPDKRKVLMSFTRLATATASPTTPQRNATRLHRTVDSRNEPEEPGSLRKAKRPRVLAEDGTNGSKTQSEASTTGNATQDTPLVVELPSEVRFSLSLSSAPIDDWLALNTNSLLVLGYRYMENRWRQRRSSLPSSLQLQKRSRRAARPWTSSRRQLCSSSRRRSMSQTPRSRPPRRSLPASARRCSSPKPATKRSSGSPRT